MDIYNPVQVEAFRKRMEERGREAVQASLDDGLYYGAKKDIAERWLAGDNLETAAPAEPVAEESADAEEGAS